MAASTVVPIARHQHNLAKLLDEIRTITRELFGVRGAGALLKKWNSLISDGRGFVLRNGSDCIGLLLYSTEYELGFSSFLSPSSARRLSRSATISVCHVLEPFRNPSASHEKLLLKSAVSRLRSVKSIETIAVQLSPLYELDLEGSLARTGFMTCTRVQMERHLKGRISRSNPPRGCTIEVPTPRDADALRSIVYHSYFSEIDGYLFPDIAAVCSDVGMFKEFLSSSSIDQAASVMARVQGYPCGCVIVLTDEDRRCGLIGVVGVIPSMRHRGIARAMLLRVMYWLQEHRHTRAALAVTVENQPARSLYSSLGFEEIGAHRTISVWRRSASRPLMNFPPGVSGRR